MTSVYECPSIAGSSSVTTSERQFVTTPHDKRTVPNMMELHVHVQLTSFMMLLQKHLNLDFETEKISTEVYKNSYNSNMYVSVCLSS